MSYEYAAAMGEPFYPVPTAANQALYERYRQRAEQATRESACIFAVAWLSTATSTLTK